MSKNQKIIILIFGLFILTGVCTTILTIAGGAHYLPWDWLPREIAMSPSQLPGRITVETALPSQSAITPGLGTTPQESLVLTPVPGQTPHSSADVAGQMLELLESWQVPTSDPIDLAERLQGKQNIQEVLAAPPPQYKLGDEQTFWTGNSETNVYFQVKAHLSCITDHFYFWIEDGLSGDRQAVDRLCETFENKIYPMDHRLFGSEWTPGVDNDPHLYALYTRGLGVNVGGYFYSGDEYLPDARQYSNAHEMFYLSADGLSLNNVSIYGTLAHELQHMIHWYHDRNEQIWVSEGLSTLAEVLNGYRSGGSDLVYVRNPDIQLNTWPNHTEDIPHYGASFLFFAYFLDRFGEDALKAVVSEPENGLEGIDAVLAARKPVDPQNGKAILADDVFADWVVTTYLNDPNAGDGRYQYRRYNQAPRAGSTEEINQCSPNWQQRDVHQYGVDYIDIKCSGAYTLKLEGAKEVPVIPENVLSGSYAFWSNRGDSSDMTLTRTFDFTQSGGQLTLQYHIWYDLEKNYDYVYLAASEDGQHWEILKTPSGTDDNITGNNYGWGYNGSSGGWVEESVDLSRFAGKKIQLRFEYVTDLAVNGEGFLLQNVQIPEINYSEDFQTSDGGWKAKGFIRILNRLPQKFVISIIRKGLATSVETVKLGEGETASISLNIGGDVKEAILVISGITRFTVQPAHYRFSFAH